MAHLAARSLKVPAGTVVSSVELIASAFQNGTIPSSGAVLKRGVQAAYSVLSAKDNECAASLPNPFEAPHNLSWYFRTNDAPIDVRHFATRLGRGHIRVWSVAQSADEDWKVLVQIFSADTKNEAVSEVAAAALRPCAALKNRVLQDVAITATPKVNLPSVFHRNEFSTKPEGHFVELTITK